MGLKFSKEKNFSEWYSEVIQKAELADYTSVSGAIVFRPLGYALWEKIRDEVNKRFKEIGIKNTYFPLLIPESLLKKEAKHFTGFTPEVAWVTQAGSNKLPEKLAVRPTSEVIMYESYKKWIRSWRDLPLRINQWNNVVRWEFKHPTPFLRSREFLWNEGHNVYSDPKELLKDRDRIMKIYKEVVEEFMAIPGLFGVKSRKETFPGAVATYTLEYLLPDGKAIQGPDYHDDGQNFAKAFDITFVNKYEKEEYVYQSTYAITTRMLGVLIAVHGDDKGLVLPPKIAPTKVVIIPIFNKENRKKILAEAKKVASKLKVSLVLDDRKEYSPGWKFTENEIKGVPVRIEIGPKDLEKKQVIIVRRDTGEKRAVKIANVKAEVDRTLNAIQKNLFNSAKKFLNSNIHTAKDYYEFKKILKTKKGLVFVHWCENQACEGAIKDETGAKIINMPLKQTTSGKCIYCKKPARKKVYFAKSY